MKDQNYVLSSSVALLLVLGTLPFVLPAREPTWDAAVYWGAGKFLWSGGTAGLWEPLRPPVLPFILGAFWFIGASPWLAWWIIGACSLIVLVFLLRSILPYVGIRRPWALLALVSPLLVFTASRGLTELPAAVLALAALVLFAQRRYGWAGVVAAVAFLTKFPMGVLIVAFMIALTISPERQRWSAIARCVVGWSIPVLAFLVVNFIVYHDILRPFVEGQLIFGQAGIELYQGSVWFYVLAALRDNVLLALAPLGCVLAFKQRTRVHIALACAPLLLFAYFTIVEHKEVRFFALMVPMVGVLAALALQRIDTSWMKGFAIVAVVAQAGLVGTYYAHYDAPVAMALAALERSLEGIQGDILVANPRPALAIDNRLTLLYYPFLNAAHFMDETQQLERYGALVLNDCDMQCLDASCDGAKDAFLARADEIFSRTSTVIYNGCEWTVYER